MGGISQRAMDGGEMNAHGWVVFHKEPGRRCDYALNFLSQRKKKLVETDAREQK
jgi:hypothetical protein